MRRRNSSHIFYAPDGDTIETAFEVAQRGNGGSVVVILHFPRVASGGISRVVGIGLLEISTRDHGAFFDLAAEVVVLVVNEVIAGRTFSVPHEARVAVLVVIHAVGSGVGNFREVSWPSVL